MTAAAGLPVFRVTGLPRQAMAPERCVVQGADAEDARARLAAHYRLSPSQAQHVVLRDTGHTDIMAAILAEQTRDAWRRDRQLTVAERVERLVAVNQADGAEVRVLDHPDGGKLCEVYRHGSIKAAGWIRDGHPFTWI